MFRKITMFLLLMGIILSFSCKIRGSKVSYVKGEVLEYKIVTEAEGDFLNPTSSTYILIVLKQTNGRIETYKNWLESDTTGLLSLIHACKKRLKLGIIYGNRIKTYECW